MLLVALPLGHALAVLLLVDDTAQQTQQCWYTHRFNTLLHCSWWVAAGGGGTPSNHYLHGRSDSNKKRDLEGLRRSTKV
jgi:hypothetical protein